MDDFQFRYEINELAISKDEIELWSKQRCSKEENSSINFFDWELCQMNVNEKYHKVLIACSAVFAMYESDIEVKCKKVNEINIVQCIYYQSQK